MKLTYWICEHKDRGAALMLRFNTREEFDKHIAEAGVRHFVQSAYDIPRMVTVEGDNVLEIINACLDKGRHQPLPWEKK